MLVTDDVPDTYEYKNVFREYNQPHIPVRVFTYLIGENSDHDAAKWMACENKGASTHLLFHKHTCSGYFSHVKSLAEVQEQVLKYIEVMARPLVLLQDVHPIRWAGLHADIKVRTKQTKNAFSYFIQFQILLSHLLGNIGHTC